MKPPNQKGRNRCGIGFILSPMARKAWINAGQQALKQYHAPDGMAKIASIKLTFNLGKSNQRKIFLCLVYAPDNNYEKSLPYEDFMENLTDTVKDCPRDCILI